MSNQSVTYLVGACLGVFGLAAFLALVLVPAITSYRKPLERVAVVVLSMYVLAALIGLELGDVKAIAAEAGSVGICAAANDNGGGQVVLSGAKAAVEHAVELAKLRGAKRAMMLSVSAPFHCPRSWRKRLPKFRSSRRLYRSLRMCWPGRSLNLRKSSVVWLNRSPAPSGGANRFFLWHRPA